MVVAFTNIHVHSYLTSVGLQALVVVSTGEKVTFLVCQLQAQHDDVEDIDVMDFEQHLGVFWHVAVHMRR